MIGNGRSKCYGQIVGFGAVGEGDTSARRDTLLPSFSVMDLNIVAHKENKPHVDGGGLRRSAAASMGTKKEVRFEQ